MTAHVKRLLAVVSVCIILTLQFSSCANYETEVIQRGDYTFTVKSRGDTVIGITVQSDGRNQSEINVTGKNLTFVDLNYDGYEDIRLDSLSPSLGAYECFILRPTIGKFVRSSAFSTLIDPEWDGETQTVTSRLNRIEYCTTEVASQVAYEETRAEMTWKWLNGALVQIAETGITYYSSEGIYCCYTCTYDEGVLVRDQAGERWFSSIEALISAGYVWDDGSDALQ